MPSLRTSRSGSPTISPTLSQSAARAKGAARSISSSTDLNFMRVTSGILRKLQLESALPPNKKSSHKVGADRLWWAHLDLNQEPSGYEPAALTT